VAGNGLREEFRCGLVVVEAFVDAAEVHQGGGDVRLVAVFW
jgi:hypothetical protein